MVRQVHRRRLVRRRDVVDPQLVLVRQRVRHRRLSDSPDTPLRRPCSGSVSSTPTPSDFHTGLCAPDHLVEPLDPAVQVVLALSLTASVVRHAVERELALADPVAVPPDDRPEVRA